MNTEEQLPEIDYVTLAEVYWQWGMGNSPEERLLAEIFSRRLAVVAAIALAALTVEARAMTTIVHDPGLTAKTAADEVVNFAKWAKTEVDAAETQVNTLRTYENTVLQVARFGDPAALRSIPGVSTVAELYQMYGQLSRDYVSAQALLNPQRYQRDMNSILSNYQLPQWNGYTAANGLPVLPAQGLFQFPTASWNVANNAQQELKTLDDQRQRLQQQRDQALSSLQSATTASDVQKYHAVVTGLNGAIAEVAHAEQELYHRTGYQNQQLQAGQQIYNASQAERRFGLDYHDVDAGLNWLPTGDMNRPVLWAASR